VLTAEQSRPGVFDFLLYFNILDKDTMEGPDAKSRAVGTGPFTFVDYAQGDRLRLSRNKNYWKSGRPYLDGIDVTILKDQQAMMAQLEGGALDVADNPPLRDVARLKQDSKYVALLDHKRGLFYYVVVNTTFKPLDNKEVRQALNYAIDRKRFTDTVLLGLAGGPQDLPWADESPAFDASLNERYSFDLDKAKSLLDASGVSNVELTITYTVNNESTAFAQIYQADLTKIGVKATLAPVETSTYNDQIAKLSYKGVIYNLGSQAHLQEAATAIAGTRSFNPDNGSSGVKDAQYSDLITSAATEADVNKRKQVYARFNDYVLDQAFTMPISASAISALTTARVHDLKVDMIPRYVLRDVWMD
jgi:peptide/nickel transport system substrate-binding protein